MLDADATLTLRAVVGGEVVKTAELTGDAAFFQLTYEYGKTVDASHDFVLGDTAIGVSPEKRSVLSAWSDLTSASELRIGADGSDLRVDFYSLNDENPDLTMESDPVRVVGPVIVRARSVVRSDTGETLAERTAEDYWCVKGKMFSDVGVAGWRDPKPAVEPPPGPAIEAQSKVPSRRLTYLLDIERKWESVAPVLEAISKDGPYMKLKAHRDGVVAAAQRLAERVKSEVAYGDQWPEIAALEAAMATGDPTAP